VFAEVVVEVDEADEEDAAVKVNVADEVAEVYDEADKADLVSELDDT